ncbi:tetratricopeptide repeat protein [Salinithrix halophila]|uniref:Tetratricopeptide repeat protein n=1 Tax=Salinithrix halophila TaxID=1485204 RepID=A0ABV8JE52_9BACL
MNQLNIHEIGEIIRKIRKERGFRLEDLADVNISPATISNIERGVAHVKQDKLIYLLEKLDISMDMLPQILQREQQEQKDLKFRLTAAESLERMGQSEQALVLLNDMELADNHLYAPTWHWLRGGCYLFLRKLQKAERELSTAVRLSSQNQPTKTDNIEAYSFSDLSLVSYYQNDLQQAIYYVERGLEAYTPEGGRKVVKYLLLRNKAIYLERLGRIVEALTVVQDVWNELAQIEQEETVLTFYWLRAELLRKSGSLEEAIQYAQEGIDRAGLNYDYKMTFDLWSVLGSIYTTQQDWEKAETCFNIAMGIPKKLVSENRFIRNLIHLGRLYMEQKKWDQAEQQLTLSIREAEKSDSAAYLTDALLAAGKLYYLQGETEKAIPHYRRAAEIAQRRRYKEKEYQAWYHLAKCWRENNEQEFRHCTENMYRVQDERYKEKEAGDFHEGW